MIFKKSLKVYLILFVILLAGCARENKDLEFEVKVLEEVFPALIDSTCFDSRVYILVPPQNIIGILDEKDSVNIFDTSKFSPSQIKNLAIWEKELIRLKDDTSRIVIAFNPEIKPTTEREIEEDFRRHFKGAEIFKMNFKKTYLFDFKRIRLNHKFNLKSISELPEDDKIWSAKYDFNFSGILKLSRLYFDKNKEFGVLDAGFLCGPRCGLGYRIFIKKVAGKWAIEQVKPTWEA